MSDDLARHDAVSDLESRQDEVLRRLEELNRQLEAALVQFTRRAGSECRIEG